MTLFLCWLLGHRWVRMTSGRGLFVHWDRCSRGCGASRIRKGSG